MGEVGAGAPVWTHSRAQADADAWALLDGFEDPGWPDTSLWPVVRDSAPTWWPTDCRARTGRRALWAFGGRRPDGSAQACGAAAPAGASSAIVQRLDLRAMGLASRLELHFALWMELPPGPDTGLFIFLRVPQGGGAITRVPIFGATGNTAAWVYPPRQLDLMNLADISDPIAVYDLRGGLWELEWQVLAPQGTAPGAGVYLDDLILVWEPDAAVTPPTPKPTGPPPTLPVPTATTSPIAPTASATPTASGTATPTPAPTASVTATAGASPTPSASPSRTPGEPTPSPAAAPVYLPILYWELPTPTPTGSPPTPTEGRPSETPTPTATPSPPPKPAYLPWASQSGGEGGPELAR